MNEMCEIMNHIHKYVQQIERNGNVKLPNNYILLRMVGTVTIDVWRRSAMSQRFH